MQNTERTWVPDGVSLDKPSPARIYDYYLGGYHNFAVDREMADAVEQIWSEVRANTAAQRAFLRRVVRFLADQGLDQFLDIGSGLPTAGNIHQLVEAVDPHARVAYVDIDPVVEAHSRILLEDNERVILIRADLAEPETILNHQDVVRLLDFGRPIALTINAVLHYLVDTEQAQAAVRALVDALEPGSYVAISHMSYEGGSEEMLERADQLFQAAANTTVRSREEIHRFFDGLELVEPGLVRGPLWRPEGPDDVLIDHPNHYLGFVGVGRKF